MIFMQENGKVSQTNGLGKSIANFFKNIGHSKDGLRSASPSEQQLLSSRHRLASTYTPQFPPIPLDSGTLQADGSKRSSSLQDGDKSASSEQDEQLLHAAIQLQRELLSKSLDELK